MAERTIVGVDFSGAQADTNTWIAEGFIETDDSDESKKGTVILESCKPVPREKLTELLKALPHDAIAALDFPFSVPTAFSRFLGHTDSDMPPLWSAIAGREREEFFSQRDEFVKQYGELLRAGDLHVPGCYSCLHDTNPNMVPMTYHGMKMLNTLWQQTECQVPPLEIPGRKGAVLLEVMPGAALKAFGLPDKGFKSGKKAFDNRQKILRELPKSSGVNVINLRDFSDEAMFADHALDAMVAAVTAAKWAMDDSESLFKRPSKRSSVADVLAKYEGKRKISPGIDHLTEEEAARKEGWIYVPRVNTSA